MCRDFPKKSCQVLFFTRQSGHGEFFPCGKSGKMLKFVKMCYVNCFVYCPGFPHLRTPCGKTCGDCGKVCVFNSYLAVFQLLLQGFPHTYTPVYPFLFTPFGANYTAVIYTSLFVIFCSKNWHLEKSCLFGRVFDLFGKIIFCGTFTNFFFVCFSCSGKYLL